MKRLAVLASLIALLGTANLARADIFMRQLQHMDAFQMMGQSQPATDVEVSVWVTKKGMRSDSSKQSAIVKPDEKVLILLDHEQRTIVKMPLDPDAMAANMAGKGKDMTPDDKAKLQKLMGKMTQIKVSITDTGEQTKIDEGQSRQLLISARTAISIPLLPLGVPATRDGWSPLAFHPRRFRTRACWISYAKTINYPSEGTAAISRARLSNLYIDDASTGAWVRKAPGDKPDVVTVVVNEESSSQDVELTVSVPAGWTVRQSLLRQGRCVWRRFWVTDLCSSWSWAVQGHIELGSWNETGWLPVHAAWQPQRALRPGFC